MSDEPGYGTPQPSESSAGEASEQEFPSAPQTNPMAIAALAAAVGGLIIPVFALGAIVLGVLALRRIKERGERGHRLAVISIVVGVLSLVITVIAIIAKS